VYFIDVNGMWCNPLCWWNKECLYLWSIYGLSMDTCLNQGKTTVNICQLSKTSLSNIGHALQFLQHNHLPPGICCTRCWLIKHTAVSRFKLINYMHTEMKTFCSILQP